MESAVDVTLLNGFGLLRTGGTVPHDIFGFCSYLQAAVRIIRIGLLDLLLDCFST